VFADSRKAIAILQSFLKIKDSEKHDEWVKSTSKAKELQKRLVEDASLSY